MPDRAVTALAFLLGGASLGMAAALALEDRRLITVSAPIVLLAALAIMLSELP